MITIYRKPYIILTINYILPATIEKGPRIMILVVTESENMIVLIIPNTATESESSILETAIINVGIPLATP